jgi:hypothetical protein
MNWKLLGTAARVSPDFISGINNSRNSKKARQKLVQKEAQMKQIMDNRQEIFDPMRSISDTSSMISNPYANLGVATQAAEMQAEEADLALANTLDTIRTSGMGAGGATALAQAAAKSKAGIAAGIEQQEANNQKLKAQGEANQQAMQQAEKIRLQQADQAADRWMFEQAEAREDEQIGLLEKQSDRAFREQYFYKNKADQAWSNFGTATGDTFGAMFDNLAQQ